MSPQTLERLYTAFAALDAATRQGCGRFDFQGRPRQARGAPGRLLGWPGRSRRGVRSRAAAPPAKFQALA